MLLNWTKRNDSLIDDLSFISSRINQFNLLNLIEWIYLAYLKETLISHYLTLEKLIEVINKVWWRLLSSNSAGNGFNCNSFIINKSQCKTIIFSFPYNISYNTFWFMRLFERWPTWSNFVFKNDQDIIYK